MTRVEEEAEGLIQFKSRSEQGKRQPLPERIANLPKDDPERVRFEKGWKAKKLNYYDPNDEVRGSGVPVIFHGSLQGILVLFVAFSIIGSVIYGILLYMERVYFLREEITWVVQSKGYPIRDPVVMEVVVVDATFRIGALEEGLRRVKLLPEKPDPKGVRREMMSYLEYIKKQNKPFVPYDAIKWLAESYR